MANRRTVFMSLLLVSVITGCNESGIVEAASTRDGRPNILLIVADDLGYADLGVYGSDISTPNIDALAATGMILTQFHTAPSCAPTRAMLLTGNNNHVAGMARQARYGIRGHPIPGYEASLSDRVAAFPKLLQESGYHTYIAGKWHLGLEDEQSPRVTGFSRSFTMLEGAGTHFDDLGFKSGGSNYRHDGERVAYPVGRYSTELYTDYLIEFIDGNKNDGRPFFAFASYTSPHWPLQVPDKYLDLYSGQYDDGYDVLRERRFETLKEAEIIPQWYALPPRNDAVTPWNDLSAEQQRVESRKMELYAAMVDNLDDQIGRLFDYLKANSLYENTLIVFMSDNGAAAEDFYVDPRFRDYLQTHFDNSYEKMGTADSFVSYDAPWAEAASPAYQRRKRYSREGGVVAPMIMSGPGVAASGAIDASYLTVMDLAPTFLEIAGAQYPQDGSVQPMLGESLNAFLAGEASAVHDDEYVTAWYHDGWAYLRQGDWKISNLDPPFDESAFELFNLKQDPGETTDLADDEPEKLAEMIALWRQERLRFGIILPEDL